jgi:hypothetical protein
MNEMKMMAKKGRGMAKAEMAKKGMAGYKAGGIATSLKAHAAAPASKAHAMKKGGSVDGCATKGKTKGKMIKMAGGGKC